MFTRNNHGVAIKRGEKISVHVQISTKSLRHIFHMILTNLYVSPVELSNRCGRNDSFTFTRGSETFSLAYSEVKFCQCVINNFFYLTFRHRASSV